MGIEYHNDMGKKQHENSNHVHYEQCGKGRKYTKQDRSMETEDKCHTKYATGARAHAYHGSVSSHRSLSRAPAAAGSRKSAGRCSSVASVAKRRSSAGGKSCGGGGGGGESGASGGCKSSRKSPKAGCLSLAQRASHCYEIKRAGRRNNCNKKSIWQHGKYVRDECGSGIVPKRFDFMPSRRLWCKTPLTMYQATIGELGRKLLCREIVVPRDIKCEPPSGIAEYILPPCRGYYRKYDCIRPCEEEYAVVKDGQKQYRDRVQRYWEPSQSKDQKHKLDVNDYASHNAFLAIKMRRKNMTDDVLCW